MENDNKGVRVFLVQVNERAGSRANTTSSCDAVNCNTNMGAARKTNVTACSWRLVSAHGPWHAVCGVVRCVGDPGFFALVFLAEHMHRDAGMGAPTPPRGATKFDEFAPVPPCSSCERVPTLITFSIDRACSSIRHMTAVSYRTTSYIYIFKPVLTSLMAALMSS